MKSTFIFILFLNLLIYGLELPSAIAQDHHPKDSVQLAMTIDSCQKLMELGKWTGALIVAEGALFELQSAQSNFPQVRAMFLSIQGDCHLELSQYNAAAADFEAALTFSRNNDEGSILTSDILNKIGNLQLAISNPSASIAPLSEALAIREQFYGPNHHKVADVLNNLGIAFGEIGDIAKAESYHRQSLRIRRNSSPVEPTSIAQSLNNLGQCLQDGAQFQEAIDYYTEGLSVYQSIDGNHELQIGDLNLNISTVYFDLGDIDQSLLFLQAALKKYEKVLPTGHPHFALCYNNLANSYSMIGDTRQAESYYDRALAIRENTFGEHHPDVAETLLNIGRNFWFEGNFEKANVKFEEALTALHYDRSDSVRLKKVTDHQLLLTGLYYAALSRKESYESLGNIIDLEQAGILSEELDQLLDYLRLQYDAADSKLNLAAYGHTVYDLAIDIMLTLKSQSGQLRYLHDAFRYSEKGKGLVLLEAFHAEKAASFGNVPTAVIESLQRIELEIAETEKGLFLQNQASDSSDIDSLHNHLFALKEELSRRIQRINQNYPTYYNLRYGAAIPSVATIQQSILRNDQTLIEYFLGNSALQIFVLNENGLDVKSIPLTVDFMDAIDSFNLAIREFPFVPSNHLERNLRTYINSAIFIYRNLISPVEHLLDSSLVIIPDGKLGFLPFEALLQNPVDSFSNFRDHPYMIRDFTISYNYSATLLSEMVQKTPVRKLDPYLGFAPNFSESPVEGLSPLLYNMDEVKSAQASLGGHIFVGEEATKSNFIKHQENYNILHLATHGKVDASDDAYSFLAFSGDDYQDPDQYSLFVRDIYELSINAQLIILSACETGTGKLFSGEGIVSIARGFSYAGASSILATRWSINDKTTNNLMGYFLEQILVDNNKDESLRNATLEYLETQNHHYSHPFYWSSFILFGDVEPIVFAAGSKWLVALSITTVLFFSYLLYRHFSKPKISSERQG